MSFQIPLNFAPFWSAPGGGAEHSRWREPPEYDKSISAPAGATPHTMSSTHLSLNYHIIFATKDRAPVIAPEWRSRLHSFLGGCIRSAGGVPMAVGGVADHIHLLTGLKATHCLADFMREIKSVSSRWVHEDIPLAAFAWQEGYGAFTVSMSQLESVRTYIGEQEEHHRKRSFHDEYLDFLHKHGVEFDPRFVA